MEGMEYEIARYEKGDFAFFLPSCWEHVPEEEGGFTERFDCEGVGRLSVECLPLLSEDEDATDPAEILEPVDEESGDQSARVIRLASGFVMRTLIERDSEVENFRWLHCELVRCFEPGTFGRIRFSGCVSEARLSDPEVVIHAHLVRACARRTEVVGR